MIFEGLEKKQWIGVAERLERSHSELVDATQMAMTLTNHHDWLKSVADRLIVGSNDLWRSMVISWTKDCLVKEDAIKIIERIKSALDGINFTDATPESVPLTNPAPPSPNDAEQLFPR